jgi:FkbM family methyltransferase
VSAARWKSWLDAVHRRVARSPLAVTAAVKLRNQAAAVIAGYVGESTDHARNGEQLLARQLGPDVRTFVDVGAHEGTWTELLLRYAAPGARGVCYEPHPVTAGTLRARSGAGWPVEVVQAALGAAAGPATLVEEPASTQLAHVGTGPGRAGLVVEMRTLDAEVERLGWERVDLLKIDAEGHDLHVLRGARGLLARQALGAVQFEYGSGWPAAGSTLAAAGELLAGFGYELFLLRSTGLHAPRYERFGEHFRYSNYVALTPVLLSRLRPLVRS